MECGCKGVRRCAICQSSERVKNLKRAAELELDFAAFDSYCYCSNCDACHPLHSKAFYDSDELLDLCPGLCGQGGSFKINGLLYWEDFLTEEQERPLVSKIDNYPWSLSQSGRRKQDFSPQVNFKKQKVKLGRFQGVPDYASPLLLKMETVDALKDYQILELCNLEYDESRASQIEFHFDDMWIWGERLISVNLISGAVMTLISSNEEVFDDGVGGRSSVVYVPMKTRSLLAMYDDARYKWKHGILKEHIRGRRIALTMREPSEKFKPGGELFDNCGREMMERARKVVAT